ncbi:hypothetical protein niasHT_032675 [Heterodera trifolii]|uniref:Uncharacterized protein n=1 Tax=Heterodera trifolii TaxID=157864 RepID=A0ABD2J5U4_9BILA
MKHFVKLFFLFTLVCPPNSVSASRCDILGDDCEPTRELLRKTEALLRCCSPCVCREPSELYHVKIPSGDPLEADDTLVTKMDAQEIYDERKSVCDKCFGTTTWSTSKKADGPKREKQKNGGPNSQSRTKQ